MTTIWQGLQYDPSPSLDALLRTKASTGLFLWQWGHLFVLGELATSMVFEVFRGSLQNFFVILKGAQPSIASVAQNSADFSGSFIVINLGGRLMLAYCTYASLSFDEFLNFGCADSIPLHKVVMPEAAIPPL